MGYKPNELCPYVKLPGSLPYIFDIILKPEVLHKVGILATILEEFSKRHIPLFQVKTFILHPTNKIRVVIVADIKGGENTAKELVSKISSFNFTENINYSGPLFDGFVLDLWSFPPTLGEERALIFRKSFYEGFIKEGWRRLGEGWGSILYHAGLYGGINVYDKYFDLTKNKQMLLRLLEEMGRIVGFGVFKIVSISENKIVLRIYDCFECQLLKDIGVKMSSFLKGVLVGWFSRYWNIDPQKIVATERKCMARGDPYCEYIIEKRQ